ncbi:hypothetical protein [Exiguobacterium sp. CH10]|uniref:hypothetical protein n=1 Tax=Exiguobacterium sp. CH10 TaxID=2751261 RepID=UPI001BEAE438|nr:hypothetical protein [Exiguobacterium sp. CH10]
MAKKSFKLVKASAALAVTAAALTPVMAAEASTSTVELKAEVVLGGKFKEALALNTPAGVEIKWGKHLVTAINKWQTVKGQGSDGKTYIKKLYARNYPLYILDQDLGEVEAGSELEKPSIRVMYRDGKVYTQAPERFTMSSTYNTKDEGEQKVLISYNHNGNRITSFLTYTVVAGEVEFDKVMSSVDQAENKLSVSAEVKNAKADTKADLVIYPFKDMSKAVTVPATIKDGKLTAEAAGLPAGDHSFVLKSGEVVSEAMNFSVEAPMVKEINQLNGTQVQVKFNKAVDKSTLLESNGDFKANVFTMRAIDGQLPQPTFKGALSADGMTLTVTSTEQLEKRYDVVIDKVKTVKGDAVEKYAKIVSLTKDMTAPSILGSERITATQVKVKFSEPMNNPGSITFKLADGTAVTGITGQGKLVDGDQAIILNLGASSVPTGKEIVATLIGASDKAGNLLTPNPATVSIQKGDKDGVAPSVTSVSQTGAKTFEILFSEVLAGKPTVSIAGTTVDPASVVIDSKDAKKVIVTAPSVLDGEKIVTVAGAVDGSGEVQASTNRVVKFVKDSSAPVLVSSAVVVDATDKQEYLELTFDKDVKVDSGSKVSATGSFVKDYVTTPNISLGAETLSYKDASVSKKVVRVALDNLLDNQDVENARYSLNLSFTKVVSEYDVAINSASTTFTRGKDGAAVNKEVIKLVEENAIVQDDMNPSKVTITFDKSVDAASATMTSNYIIGGAVVESATVKAGALNQVILTLKADSNTFSGLRNVTVQNVKAAGSTVAMESVTKALDFKENIAPKVTAKLDSLNTIKLTFSEKVTDDAGADFNVYAGSDAVSVVSNDVALAENGLSATITLSSNVTAEQLTKGLSLQALNTIDIKDEAKNALYAPGKVVISNN